MKTVNIVENSLLYSRWANLKSQIARKINKYPENADIDIVLQVKNKFSQVNYPYDEIPETLEELLNYFPDSVNLEFCLFENGESTGELGYLKKFEDVKEESETKPETNSNQQSPQPKPETKKESDSGQIVVIDVNQLFEKYSNSLQLITSQNNKPEPVRQENQNSDLVESLRQQIADLKQIHSQQVAELKDLLKEAKEEAKLANSQLFTLQIENTRLSITAAQGVNPQSLDEKVQEQIRAYERNQKKLTEQTEEKKKELDALNLQIIEARLASRVKGKAEGDNTEINKAVADVIKAKFPQLIDRGIDLLTPNNLLPSIQNNNTEATALV